MPFPHSIPNNPPRTVLVALAAVAGFWFSKPDYGPAVFILAIVFLVSFAFDYEEWGS